MLDVLFVSIAFPPKSDPECIQTAKYYRALSKLDLKLDVVTSKIPTLFMPYDAALESYGEGINQLIELPIFENKYLNYLIRKLKPGYLQRPDSKYRFSNKYDYVIKQLKSTPRLIYSRSFPMSSAIMAYHLWQHYQVPWVLHLSDPWSWSPLHSFTGVAKTYVLTWERKLFEAASRVSLTSQKTIDYYSRIYPEFENKFIFFPNVFEDTDINTPSGSPLKEKIRIVYTGGLSGDRNPEFLLRVLQRWNQDNPGKASLLEFVLAGPLDRNSRALIRQIVLPNVCHLGMLSFNEAQELQQTADVLLIIDNPISDQDKAVFFPSKLLDYFVQRKKIMAITTKESTTAQVLRKYGQINIYHGDEAGLMATLDDICTAYLYNDSAFFTPPEKDEIFEADYNARRLYQLFLELTF